MNIAETYCQGKQNNPSELALYAISVSKVDGPEDVSLLIGCYLLGT
jgi:hypothetical protein